MQVCGQCSSVCEDWRHFDIKGVLLDGWCLAAAAAAAAADDDDDDDDADTVRVKLRHIHAASQASLIVKYYG